MWVHWRHRECMKIFLKCTDCRGLLIYEPCVFPVSVMRMTPPDAWKVLYLLNFQKEKKKKKNIRQNPRRAARPCCLAVIFGHRVLCHSGCVDPHTPRRIPQRSRFHSSHATIVALNAAWRSLKWPPAPVLSRWSGQSLIYKMPVMRWCC